MVQDHGLEVVESHLELMVDAMLVQDLVHLLGRQRVAQLGERFAQRCRTNLLLLVICGLKLAEKRAESLLRRVLLDRERCRDELVVVDDAHLIQVDFLKRAINVRIPQLGVSTNALAQLICFDRPRHVRIDLIELTAQVYELPRVDHLDEDLKTLTPQSIPTMEVYQAGEHFLADGLVCSRLLTLR